MANYLYLHNRYIIKFDFVNYAFANLVVARLMLITRYILLDTCNCCVATLTHINLESFLWDIGKQCRPRSDTA